jgi:hypothetical protein
VGGLAEVPESRSQSAQWRKDPCLPGGARACGGIRGRGRLAETGSAGRRGCGFQRVRVTEREDCLAVWKLVNILKYRIPPPCHVTEREDCLAVWKLLLREATTTPGSSLMVTEREDCLAVWKHGLAILKV